MPTVDTGSGNGTSIGTSVASSIQPSGQQLPARPDNSPLVLPRTAALRDAVEKCRQAAQASQAAQDRPRDADDSDSMQVDGHPRPEASAAQGGPEAASPLSSNTSPKTAQTAAEPFVKSEQQGTGNSPPGTPPVQNPRHEALRSLVRHQVRPPDPRPARMAAADARLPVRAPAQARCAGVDVLCAEPRAPWGGAVFRRCDGHGDTAGAAAPAVAGEHGHDGRGRAVGEGGGGAGAPGDGGVRVAHDGGRRAAVGEEGVGEEQPEGAGAGVGGYLDCRAWI
ncbi:hypothetical protein K466DRAFT_217684 [Polyporus arcularius HHB13444]|uniref:Uncharacterized protein n=1 Tax=Polyporus arcularius HHB13444 TaxID=1314778 RepID=A0A5C3PST4_9APHY|nr:hypothetical protein K466DRAFT_217684 [Polyporus arcularius HHB13444]